MVESARICESDAITAAMIPAPRIPASHSGAERSSRSSSTSEAFSLSRRWSRSAGVRFAPATASARRASPHQRHQRAAETEQNEAAADRRECGPTAHHADHDVWREEDRLYREDYGPDVPALPAIAKHLDGSHEAVLLAERPDPRADEKQ